MQVGGMETAPSPYNHIEHSLRPNLSTEQYGKLGSKNFGLNVTPHLTQTTLSYMHPIPPLPSSISLAATERGGGGGDYEKLHHHTSTTFVRSHTEPIILQPHPQEPRPQPTCNYTTIQHTQEEGGEEEGGVAGLDVDDDSPFSPIYSNITLMKIGGEEEGGESKEPHPPPVPPRLKKTISS